MHAIEDFLLLAIPSNPTGVVRLAMEKFQVTRSAVLFHLNKLKDKNLIVQHGTRNKVSYEVVKTLVAKDKLEKTFVYEVGQASEDEIWNRDVKPIIGQVKKNVMDICQYGFTEMFNNVIDHSASKKAWVVIIKSSDILEINIIDHGIGIFKKIAEFFGISEIREAVVRLHQGKVTTDRSKHSGQGVFFTSRAFDQFVASANGFLYLKDNSKEDDWYFEKQDSSEAKGTHVKLSISLGSKRILKEVFDAYTNGEDFRFDKSHIRIELGKFEEDSYVSRSQAKRLLAGLDDFGSIVLDFKNIRNVGQAFVDEVFGVFGLQHPEAIFIIKSANPDVLLMIRRGLADRKFPLERVMFDLGENK